MKKIGVLLLVLVGVLALSACKKEEAAQGVTDTVVTVGNSAATSGALAPVGVPFNQGIQSYFDMVNANGGVAGRTINFITYDDQFTAATGLTYAEKLVEDDIFILLSFCY